MRFEDAYRLGSVGERRVSDALHAEAAALGYRVLDDVLLDLGETTAQLDHLIIDQHGILVVETKVRSHAIIRGKSHERKWTVCYPGGKRKRMQNPLLQNDRHRELLHRVLLSFGRNLPESYIQSLVVFHGAKLEHMSLSDVDQMRVVPFEGLVDFIRDRYNFVPNEGAMAEDVDDLVSLLESVDKSADHEVVARHAETVSRVTSRFRVRVPSLRSSKAPARPALSRAIFDDRARYPDGTHVPKRRTATRGSLRLVLLLASAVALLFVAVSGGYLESVAPGFSAVIRGLMESVTGVAPAQSPTPQPGLQAAPAQQPPAQVDVPLARRRLQERFPGVAAKVQDPSNPSVTQAPGTATYRWTFFSRTEGGSGSVRGGFVTITLDAGGNVVGLGID